MFFINKVEILEESMETQSLNPDTLSRIKTESEKIQRSSKNQKY